MRATLTGSRAEREECVGGWGGPGTELLGGSGEIGGGRVLGGRGAEGVVQGGRPLRDRATQGGQKLQSPQGRQVL